MKTTFSLLLLLAVVGCSGPADSKSSSHQFELDKVRAEMLAEIDTKIADWRRTEAEQRGDYRYASLRAEAVGENPPEQMRKELEGFIARNKERLKALEADRAKILAAAKASPPAQ